MERPLIKRPFIDKIKKVYEYDDVHYFYWPIEIGLGMSKIFGIRIPTGPLKLNDYEPIKIMKGKNGNYIVMTRFHYDLLIYFNEPLLKGQRILIEFIVGSHSPLIYTGKDNSISLGFTTQVDKGMDSRLIDKIMVLLVFYQKIVQKVLFKEIKEKDVGEYDDIINQQPPSEFLFNINDFKCIMWIGRFPTKEELNHIGFNI
jgi:hypothetical protein